MPHAEYNARIAEHVAELRGTKTPAIQSDLFLRTVPSQRLEGAPPDARKLLLGSIYETRTSILCPVITNENELWVLKLIPPQITDHPICINYNSDNGRVLAQSEAIQNGKIFNNGNIYLYKAQVLRWEYKEGDSSQMYIILSPPLQDNEVNVDTRFPDAVVMNDLVFRDSIKTKLENGKLREVQQLLPRILADFHMRRTHALSPEEAMKYASFSSLEEKFDLNYSLAKEGLKNIISASLNPKKYDNLLPQLDHVQYSMFVTHKDFLEAVFMQRIIQKQIRNIHGDLKAEHIKELQTVPIGTHPYASFGFIDSVDFNPLISNGDVLADLSLLCTDIEVMGNAIDMHELPDRSVRRGNNPFVKLARNTHFRYRDFTHKPYDVNEFSYFMAEAYYFFQNLLIRIGVKAGLNTEIESAAHFADLLQNKIDTIQMILKQV